MRRPRDTTNTRNGAVELWIVWASVVPQAPTIGDLVETQDLLDAAVAVGTHNEDIAFNLGWALLQSHNQIVVKLALLPMIDVLPTVRTQSVEEAFKTQRVG